MFYDTLFSYLPVFRIWRSLKSIFLEIQNAVMKINNFDLKDVEDLETLDINRHIYQNFNVSAIFKFNNMINSWLTLMDWFLYALCMFMNGLRVSSMFKQFCIKHYLMVKMNDIVVSGYLKKSFFQWKKILQSITTFFIGTLSP